MQAPVLPKPYAQPQAGAQTMPADMVMPEPKR
jgi:hypothetical protein